MKKIFLVISVLFLSCGVVFSKQYWTGDAIPYYPYAAPKVASKGGDNSSCYIAKVAKAASYPDGTYEIQVVSADWIGPSVFPLIFTYIAKKGDILLMAMEYDNTPVALLVQSVSDNSVELVPQPETVMWQFLKGTATSIN